MINIERAMKFGDEIGTQCFWTADNMAEIQY